MHFVVVVVVVAVATVCEQQKNVNMIVEFDQSIDDSHCFKSIYEIIVSVVFLNWFDSEFVVSRPVLLVPTSSTGKAVIGWCGCPVIGNSLGDVELASES